MQVMKLMINFFNCKALKKHVILWLFIAFPLVMGRLFRKEKSTNLFIDVIGIFKDKAIIKQQQKKVHIANFEIFQYEYITKVIITCINLLKNLLKNPNNPKRKRLYTNITFDYKFISII